MVNPAREANISSWEGIFYKVFPLIGFAPIPFSYIPEVAFIDPQFLPKIALQLFWIAPVVGFLIELGRAWPNKNERGHFGVPLLAMFSIIGGVMAANNWFEFYQIGNNSWIDMLVYLYLIMGAVILLWGARVEVFKRKKVRYNITTALSR